VTETIRLLSVLLCLLGSDAGLAADALRLASTTSTQDSGLFDSILPRFREATGITVEVVAVGTGRALDLGRRGDTDAVLVHAPAAELAFVAEGAGIDRRTVMYNHFLLVGPADDPAGIRGNPDPAAALHKIAAAGAPFASRGDDSGTQKRERALWESAGVEPAGAWYRETGSGMGSTLNTAAELPAYTLVDSGTWLAFANRRGLETLVEGGKALHNPYAIIRVNPERHPHVAAAAALAFADWLVSEPGREAIAAHRVGGEQLFFPIPATEAPPAEVPMPQP
jgi:tungstate transport system substrate-binding protein